jgi:N-acetylglucosamine-6-phosphate deacetylase
MPRHALSANTVVSSAGVLSPGVVFIEDGKIVSVERFSGADAEFDVLAPGLIDIQVNGIGRIDAAVADRDEWSAIGHLLLEQGVTTWCPTFVTAPDSDVRGACGRAAAAQVSSELLPEIAGVHLEGPFITVVGAHRTEYVRDHVPPDWVDQLNPVVQVVTLAPEVPGALEAIEQLARRGILVSIGHSRATAEEAHAAAAAGARLVTHLGNANGPFHQRNPGILGAALADERLAVSLIADLEHVHTDLLRIAFAAKEGGVVLVTDSVAALAGHVGPVSIHAGGPGDAARLEDGTLAGSTLTMDEAIRNVVDHAQIWIEEAIGAASTTPAALLGLRDRGAIAPGLRADLVALRSGSLSVESVWVRGQLAWPVGGSQ